MRASHSSLIIFDVATRARPKRLTRARARRVVAKVLAEMGDELKRIRYRKGHEIQTASGRGEIMIKGFARPSTPKATKRTRTRRR